MSVNKVILVGRLGADPDFKHIANGQPVCEMSIATSESWKDKDGTRQERTEWSRVKVWGKNAEACSKYLSKGREVYVEGRLQTRSYEKDGVKKYITEIIAQDVQFLGGGRGDSAQSSEPAPPTSGGGYGGGGGKQFVDDDLPFATADASDEPSPIRHSFRRWGG